MPRYIELPPIDISGLNIVDTTIIAFAYQYESKGIEFDPPVHHLAYELHVPEHKVRKSLRKLVKKDIIETYGNTIHLTCLDNQTKELPHPYQRRTR